MKRTILPGIWLCAAIFFLTFVFYGFGWLMRPDRSRRTVVTEKHMFKPVDTESRLSFAVEQLPELHAAVNYNHGSQAAWFPKGESPVLAELVEEGDLPAVAERVGPEPCVMKGVDGIGVYGGTWQRLATSEADIQQGCEWRIGALFLRWSPGGYPLKPHLAKSWEMRAQAREYIVHLRHGVRWSDGYPFTARDILYWWEHEVKHFQQRPRFMTVRGELGNVEMIDDYTVRFTFPYPYALFPEAMAREPMWAPEHYLRQFHPAVGDSDKIDALQKVQSSPSARTAYFRLKNFRNPEHPRLWPWVFRAHQTSPPYELVRNPFYWVVDTAGNQLPYLDRVLYAVRSEEMVPVTAAAGAVSMQMLHIRYADYTLYSEQQKAGGYKIYKWYPGDRSTYAVFPNLNRRIDPDSPETEWKHALLNDQRFRQALSLAINRQDIIAAEFHGETEPAQISPGPESPFHHPRLFKSFTDYAPARANHLLDEIGLTIRDDEGYRTFPNRQRMTFFLHITPERNSGVTQFLIDDWAAVGIRVIMREQAGGLWQIQQSALEHDLTVWEGTTSFVPLAEPREFVPVNIHSFYAPGYARWYQSGGLYGKEDALPSALMPEPPATHPLRRSMEILEAALAEPDAGRRHAVFAAALDIAADNVWSINICTPPPQLVLVKSGFKNVPRQVVNGWAFLTPANAGVETYFFETPVSESSESLGRLKQLMTETRPDPGLSPQLPPAELGSAATKPVGKLLVGLLYGILALGAAMAVIKHPFIARRCLILVPTLLLISIATFIIIQLPPSSYLEHRLIELEMQGNAGALQQVRELKEAFHADAPLAERYLRWMGIYWFAGFAHQDRGLLQGYLGLSMEQMRPVNEIVGDRIVLTVLISLFAVLFTWVLAIPIGIYSAVRQYTLADYIFMIVGFLGMSIPSLLLALVLMYVAASAFGIHVGGLFSPEYATVAEWSWGKVMDLLKHVWIPVFVIGVGGTAGMIRVMRANLLDELKKPYVTTARAKGLRPLQLLFKYPVRIALNPFVSGIGNLFPQLVSGAAVVSLILSLPTVGPLLLSALMAQDMYLAGSMLMVLSLLAVFGTLVSDLLLMWLDPRVRMGRMETR